jgi:UDP-2,3-diacylglucosamine hydrolase
MSKVIGVIAGGGALPLRCIEKIKAQGDIPAVIAITGDADPHLSQVVEKIAWFPLGKISAPLRQLTSWGVSQVVVIGGIRRQGLFTRIRPDWRALSMLRSLLDKRDDALLRAVAGEIEREGITVVAAHQLVPDLAATVGTLTARELSTAEQRDLVIGWQAAAVLGAADIGQSLVAFEGTVVAVEAVEGTDAMMRRAGELTAKAGGVLVKRCKPNQDQRMDLPTIGLRTLQTAQASGITAIAIEAGRTLLVDPQELLAAANQAGIAIVGRAN